MASISTSSPFTTRLRPQSLSSRELIMSRCVKNAPAVFISVHERIDVTLKILTKIYYWLLSCLAVVGMIGYIGAVVIQVFSRTFLPSVPSWTEEAARYLFIYSVAIGAGIVSMKDEYARVDILTAKFPAGLKKCYEILVCLILIVFDVYLAYITQSRNSCFCASEWYLQQCSSQCSGLTFLFCCS